MPLIWWLALAFVGGVTYPLLLGLGWRNESALLGWARPAGLLLWAWASWLLGNLLPLSWASGVALASLVVLGGWAACKQRARLRAALQEHWRTWLIGEGLLLLVGGWVLWSRGWAPGVAHTEQPMDIAFLASCLRAEQMPPADPWLAGEPISYYYLGYLLWSLVARLTGASATMAYNLALAATAGLAAQSLYGLLLHLLPRRRLQRIGAAVGAPLILMAGNLAYAAESLHGLGLLPGKLADWLGVPGLADAAVTGSLRPAGNWWWRASRPWRDWVLPGHSSEVIVEFPAFSLALGDLHPHLLALPLSVAVVGLILSTGQRPSWRQAAALGLLIGGVGFCSGWELPLLLGLTVLWQGLGLRAGQTSWRTAGARLGLILAAALLPYLPFWLQLDSQVTGLGVSWLSKTPLHSYLLALGAWAVPALLWVGVGQGRSRRLWRWWGIVLAITCGVVLAAGGVGRLTLSLIGLGRGAALALGLSLALAFLLDRLWQRPAEQPTASLLLLLLGLGLTYGAEWVYLGDLFGTRMNTVFKLYYQAWWLLGVVAVAGMVEWLLGRGWRRGIAVACLLGWLGLCGYSLLVMPAQDGAWSLDALSTEAPDEAEAVVWLQEHGEANDVLLAAPGATYDPASVRLSSLSGVPMVLGWPGHERQWGREADEVERRTNDVALAYTSPDPEEREDVLRRYRVTLVMLGARERELYGEEVVQHERWAPQCQVAHENAELTLLRCAP